MRKPRFCRPDRHETMRCTSRGRPSAGSSSDLGPDIDPREGEGGGHEMTRGALVQHCALGLVAEQGGFPGWMHCPFGQQLSGIMPLPHWLVPVPPAPPSRTRVRICTRYFLGGKPLLSGREAAKRICAAKEWAWSPGSPNKCDLKWAQAGCCTAPTLLASTTTQRWVTRLLRATNSLF